MFNFLEMVDFIIKCLFSVVFIVISSPYTLILVGIQLAYFYTLRSRIIIITRDCFKLVQITNSPIISLIQDSMNGQVTMRALGGRHHATRELMRQSDEQTRAHVTSNGVNRYSAFRIDMQAYYIATIFAGISLFGPAPKTASQLAVQAIGFQMAVEVARHFNQAIRWTFKMEMDLVAVQRIMAYANLTPEDNPELVKGKQELDGSIEFNHVMMRYQEHLEPALKDLSFKIAAGEKVAVVGRTGAGKSSFFQILQGFREINNGQILIGGRSIQSLSKKQIRKNLTVVLQNPYINENESVRNNLLGYDASLVKDRPSDEQLKLVLAKAALENIYLDDKASVLSGGQVQLLSLAQAMLNPGESSIILLDEPTSHIDGKSQERVLDELFALAKQRGQTVLMVAHRLDTAVNYCDKILVLDKGQKVQFDEPLKLLCEDENDEAVTKHNSIFASMVLALTYNQQDKILELAKSKKNNSIN